VVGAALLVILPEWLRFMVDWRLAVFGALLVAILLVRRQGILDRQVFAFFASRGKRS
jgi:branched-chain amino acid transport system permease protein